MFLAALFITAPNYRKSNFIPRRMDNLTEYTVKKEWPVDACKNLDEFEKHYAEKNQNILYNYFYVKVNYRQN